MRFALERERDRRELEDLTMEHIGRSGLEVGAFYDATLDALAALYDGCIHTGYWARGATKLTDAQRDLTELVMDTWKVLPGGHLLDLGCGHGGPAIHAAQRMGVQVTGVTVSAAQVQAASFAAKEAGVASLVEFQMADMTAMPFPDACFDGAFAIESLLFHVADKAAALAEIFRVLRPGASLAIADHFLMRKMPLADRQLAADMLRAAPLLTLTQVFELVEEAGFDLVKSVEITRAVRVTAPYLVAALKERRDALIACVGAEGVQAVEEAVREYNRIYLEGQGYVVLEACKTR
jgi:cyclopropane fatty-acyl-phospholipid synthase-like methyltransferase